MNIYPAIDLRNGKVVRLKYGDPNQQTTYSDDPIETARRWAEAGASWIHVVNLDGAFGDDAGAAAINRSLLQSLTTVGPQIQFGGGLRSIGDVEAALSRGAARVVIGTLAIEQPDVLREAVERFGSDRVVVGLDAQQRPREDARLAKRWRDRCDRDRAANPIGWRESRRAYRHRARR